jgi:hypothetical protein
MGSRSHGLSLLEFDLALATRAEGAGELLVGSVLTVPRHQPRISGQ